MSATARAVGVAALAFVAACQPRVESAVDPRVAESEIRERSRAVVAAEIRKDLETVMPFYADSAVIHMEGAPAIRGHAAIRQVYRDFFSMPGLTFEAATITELQVARSGELAYETGINHFTMDRGGQRVPATGKYLLVWRRDADGRWLISRLAVTNDRPAP